MGKAVLSAGMMAGCKRGVAVRIRNGLKHSASSPNIMMRQGNRNARRMAGRMGMDMKPVPNVTEVIIRTPDREVVITKPDVSEVESKQNTTFVVVAVDFEEREVEKPQFSDDDVEMVCLKTGVDRDRAVAALTECDGEMATAIVRLMS